MLEIEDLTANYRHRSCVVLVEHRNIPGEAVAGAPMRKGAGRTIEMETMKDSEHGSGER